MLRGQNHDENGTRTRYFLFQSIFLSKLSHFSFNVKLPFYLVISLNTYVSGYLTILKSETA